MGAWAIIQVHTWCDSRTGSLGGLSQTSDPAELVAIKEAIKYATVYKDEVTLWTDSAFAATGVNRLLSDPQDILHDKATEDWEEVQQALFPESACEGFFVKKQPLYYIFTPSHLQI